MFYAMIYHQEIKKSSIINMVLAMFNVMSEWLRRVAADRLVPSSRTAIGK